MNRFFSLLLLPMLIGRAHAENDSTAIQCIKSAAFLAPLDSPDSRKYAPDRDFQILHLLIDVIPDFKQRTIEGKTTIRFKPLVQPAHELKLDAVELNIHSVEASEKIQGFQVSGEKLVVTFTQPLQPEKEVTVTIAYSAEPKKGLYF